MSAASVALRHVVTTSHGSIHTLSLPPNPSANGPATATSLEGPTLLFIHGNSSAHQAFDRLLFPGGATETSAVPQHHPVLVLDLPGHGASTDAPDPIERSYTQRGYAECVLEVLRELRVAEVVVLGWSLGGHIAIEMLDLLEGEHSRSRASGGGDGRDEESGVKVKGIMIVGTPPALGREQVCAGFKGMEALKNEAAQGGTDDDDEHMLLAGREHWSSTEYKDFVSEGMGPPREDWMEEAARRTDGRARRIMFDAFLAGRGADQRSVLERTRVPCAVVNGAAEPYLHLDYVDGLRYGNLWEGRCHRLQDLGHAPFWEKPEVFGPIWRRFVEDCTGKKY